ncbi:putative ribonuclease H-like domain-containing protein [Tanacetum coccineum]
MRWRIDRFVYLGGQIPIDASTLPNADLPIDPNMLDLEDDSNVFPNNGIFSGAYDDKDVDAEADFNNMDNTIDVTPIPTLRVHKDHLKEEPKTISQALKDKSWVEAMQEELLQFKLQKVWILVDLPFGKRQLAQSGSSGIRGMRGVLLIEAIRLFLSFASFMRFPIYQMDVKSAFLYGTIGEEVYVHQPSGFVDPAHPHKVYKVDKAIYGLHQAPRAWYDTFLHSMLGKWFRRESMCIEFEDCMHKRFQMSSMGELTFFLGLQANIMFAVCACARHQVNPKASHLNAVKRIFRHLKHQPKLGLWYPRDSPFELEAYSDSDYRGANLDKKSTTAANCCGQVLWIQNQMMDYGFNLMNTKIHIDNESTISVIKNHVSHSRTKHIEIRFHSIRDCYEKRLIEVIKIHTDNNVADLLTKGFEFNHIQVLSGQHNTSLSQKPTESVGFTKIVDFIKGTSLRGIFLNKLQLADATGISNLSDAEIYEGLATLSSKSGIWDQFGSPIATVLLCLSRNRVQRDQGEGSANPAKPNPTSVDPVLSTSQIPIPSTTEPPHSSPLRESGEKIQDIDDDPLVSLVRESMKEADFVTPTNEDFNPGSIEVNTSSAPVSTPSVVQTVNVVIPSPVKSQREGKAPMTTEETQATKRTKAQIQQEKAGFAEAMRLKSLQDEEAARQVHFDALLAKRISEEQELSKQQKKRKPKIQEAGQCYTEEDWDTIKEKLEGNAELTKSLQGESVIDDDFAKRMVEMINQKKKYYAEQKAKAKRSKPMTQAQQRYYMSTFIKNQSSWKFTQLKKLTFKELKIEFEKLVKSIERFMPMETEERVKRQGIQLEQEPSKKQKIIEKVPVIEESDTELVIVKEKEIEKPVKKRGKIKKQKARKGIHVDKTAQDETEEEREAKEQEKKEAQG